MPSPHNGANQKTDGFRLVRGALPASIVVASIVVASLACSSAAFAEDRSYGRFDGDLALAGELALVASEDGPALGVRATASYLTMAGAYAEYDEGLDRQGESMARRLSGGIELRPLFLARFVGDLETGAPLFDLWLDSLGFGLGTFITWHPAMACAENCQRQGLEFAGRMALPLLARANGPFVALRGGARFEMGTPATGSLDETVAFGALSIGFEGLIPTGLLRRAP